MVFLGDRFVVTVRRGEAGPLAGVRQLIEHDPVRLNLRPGGGAARASWTPSSTTTTVDRPARSRTTSSRSEARRLRRRRRRATPRTIYGLKREVLEFRRAALPLIEPARRLVRGRRPARARCARSRSSATSPTTCCAVVDHIESYDRLLSDILSAHLAQVSVRQNDDMRKISAWVAIAAVPTLIAGIYGMNFQHFPSCRLAVRLPVHAAADGSSICARALPGVQTLGLALSARSAGGGQDAGRRAAPITHAARRPPGRARTARSSGGCTNRSSQAIET